VRLARFTCALLTAQPVSLGPEALRLNLGSKALTMGKRKMNEVNRNWGPVHISEGSQNAVAERGPEASDRPARKYVSGCVLVEHCIN
jgi:hypothetical protein